MSNTIREMSVPEAERQLRYARLAEHRQTIARALGEKNDEMLATGASRFLAIYRNKDKKAKK